MPRAAAVLLTLALCALATWLLFSRLEGPIGRWLRRRDPATDSARVRHVMFSLAAFSAFVTFYSFAGAPTLRKLSWAPQVFGILVVLTATASLARRLPRTQKAFAEETLGRAIVKRWAWADTQPPRDLREAFFLQTMRSQESVKAYAQVLKIYKEAISENLANGFVTRDQTAVLESLRVQLQIRKAEHERVMAELAEEERAMSGDPAKPVSAEKRLQLETYERVLRSHVDMLGTDAAQDDRFLARLRAEYRVTPAEHAAVLDKILGGAQGMAGELAGELAVIEHVSLTIRALEGETSAAHEFLGDLLRRRRARALDRVIRVLRLAPEETSRQTREDLCNMDQTIRSAAIERQVSAVVTPEIAERLLAAHRQAANIASGSTLTEMLRARVESIDPYVRAVALYLLATRGEADDDLLVRLSSDEHELVRETARHFRDGTRRKEDQDTTRDALLTVEKMIALRSASIFSRLAAEELAELARSSRERSYAAGETLCVEGERGNEIFFLLEGEVTVSRRESATEKIIGTERTGALIGEMAVLDPAPRSATVVAGASGSSVLILDGEAFRHGLHADPAIADGVIRALAQRLRGAQRG